MLNIRFNGEGESTSWNDFFGEISSFVDGVSDMTWLQWPVGNTTANATTASLFCPFEWARFAFCVTKSCLAFNLESCPFIDLQSLGKRPRKHHMGLHSVAI
jgi:hypothetical protein